MTTLPNLDGDALFAALAERGRREASDRGRRNRSKAHDAERLVVRYLRSIGYPDAETTRARLGRDGTRQPGDVLGVPGVALEVKDRAASAWPTWLRQIEAEAPPGAAPVVVRRVPRKTPGLWIAATRWRHVAPWPNSYSLLGTLYSYEDELVREEKRERATVFGSRRPTSEAVPVLLQHRNAPGGTLAIGRLVTVLEALR